MKSFGWKRKMGEKVDHSTQSAFEESAADADNDREQTLRDWMKTAAKIRSVVSLDERMGDVEQVIKQGAALAEAGNYIASLRKLDAAALRCPDDERIHEMKAQVLLIMDHTEDAIEAASRSVTSKPNWWIALQTLGRAHLNNGDLIEALKAFSRALHLSPSQSELHEEDLLWSKFLLHHQDEQTSSSAMEVETDETSINETESSVDEDERYVDDPDDDYNGSKRKLLTPADMNLVWFSDRQTEYKTGAGCPLNDNG